MRKGWERTVRGASAVTARGTLIVAKTFATRWEADVAKGALDACDIPCMISADDAGGMYPFPAQSGFSGVSVYVRKRDARRARGVLSRGA